MVGPGAHRQLGVTVQVHAQRPQAACTSGRQSARGAQRELHTLPEGRPAAPSAWPSLTRHWGQRGLSGRRPRWAPADTTSWATPGGAFAPGT